MKNKTDLWIRLCVDVDWDVHDGLVDAVSRVDHLYNLSKLRAA